MNTSWESPELYPDGQTANVTELVLLWLRHAALEALDITGRLPFTPAVSRALEERLVYLPEAPMTTVLQSTLRRTLSSTAIGKTLLELPYTLLGSLVTHVASSLTRQESSTSSGRTNASTTDDGAKRTA